MASNAQNPNSVLNFYEVAVQCLWSHWNLGKLHELLATFLPMLSKAVIQIDWRTLEQRTLIIWLYCMRESNQMLCCFCECHCKVVVDWEFFRSKGWWREYRQHYNMRSICKSNLLSWIWYLYCSNFLACKTAHISHHQLTQKNAFPKVAQVKWEWL